MIKKIYFLDDNIRGRACSVFNEICARDKVIGYIIDAQCGISRCIGYAKDLEQNPNNIYLLTNEVHLLSNEYAWKDNQCNAYLWHHDDAEFINLQDLTDKDIRNAHNLSKMYIAGSFGYKGIPKN